MWLEWAPNWRSLTSQVGLLSCVPPFPNWLSLQGMVSEFIRRSHYNESVCRKKSERWKFKRNNDLKVSVLSGRYFKLTDKETEHKERKISDVGVFDPFTLVSSSQRSNSLHNLVPFLRQIWLRQQFASLPSFSWPHFWIEFPDSGHFESWFIEDHLLRIIFWGSSWPTPQLSKSAAAAGPPQDMEMDPEDQEAFLRAQASRGPRKGFRLESICWD